MDITLENEDTYDNFILVIFNISPQNHMLRNRLMDMYTILFYGELHSSIELCVVNIH